MEQLLKKIDYSVLQQCMHCGMCLPTCPTYSATKMERNSPRGRISLMRAIADNRLELTREFGQEMYYCLGCLACETACPAGVDYTVLFEAARIDIEQAGVLKRPIRTAVRWLTLKFLFTKPQLLRWVGRIFWAFQASGVQALLRASPLMKLLSPRLRALEKQAPVAQAKFSHQLIARTERPLKARYSVGLLTGCVQDIVFSDINRDTATVLLRHGCEVVTPSLQYCCGSLHVHNGELETARKLARHNIDAFDLAKLDAIITNAAGCGSHLKHYDRLLDGDSKYAAKARLWSAKVKDIHEWLVEIGLEPPLASFTGPPVRVTYHEACHLCHGQQITQQPRVILKAIPGIQLVELPESTWCCGSAGIYSITQPETAASLQRRKIRHILSTRATIVATANPGCLLQIQNGLVPSGVEMKVLHPISLLAQAYKREGSSSDSG